jgi:hypothetical protein
MQSLVDDLARLLSDLPIIIPLSLNDDNRCRRLEPIMTAALGLVCLYLNLST